MDKKEPYGFMMRATEVGVRNYHKRNQVTFEENYNAIKIEKGSLLLRCSKCGKILARAKELRLNAIASAYCLCSKCYKETKK